MVILETLNILWKNWTTCVVCDISGAPVGLELNVWHLLVFNDSFMSTSDQEFAVILIPVQ